MRTEKDYSKLFGLQENIEQAIIEGEFYYNEKTGSIEPTSNYTEENESGISNEE